MQEVSKCLFESVKECGLLIKDISGTVKNNKI
jgi:hypothetical protein